MDKIINKVFFYTKIVFLLIAFCLTLYILLIRMDSNGLSTWSVFPLFIPMLFLLILFVFSYFLNIGKDNLFFNLICVLGLLAIIIIDCRVVFDKNIISTSIINLNFFDLQVGKIKIMLYLMLISDILLIIYEKRKKIHS